MRKEKNKEKAPLTLKKKIIYYTAAAVGGVAAALLLVGLIVYIVKNPPSFVLNNTDEVKVNTNYKENSEVTYQDASVILDGEENIDQAVEANDSVEQTEQNLVLVSCDDVDTKGLSQKKN